MNALPIHPVKTRRQIADEFNINERTLRRWLKNAGISLPQRLLTPVEQLVIYQKFGMPVNTSSALQYMG
jgi:hypothetical protein